MLNVQETPSSRLLPELLRLAPASVVEVAFIAALGIPLILSSLVQQLRRRLAVLMATSQTRSATTTTTRCVDPSPARLLCNGGVLTLMVVCVQIDWQQDTLTWLVDGQTVRTLKRSDLTGDDGVSRYPSTPSRVQLRCVFILTLSPSHPLPFLLS